MELQNYLGAWGICMFVHACKASIQEAETGGSRLRKKSEIIDLNIKIFQDKNSHLSMTGQEYT